MIYPHEFRVLFMLEIEGPSTARQIVGEYRPDAGEKARALSGTLRSLHRRGLITCWSSPRPKVWANTTAGRAIVLADEKERSS